jgi:hypothetical protein
MQKTKRFYHYCVKTSINSKFNTFGRRRAILFAPMVYKLISSVVDSDPQGSETF